MGDEITVYISSISSNVSRKKQQQRIDMVLTGKHIQFKTVDISMDTAAREHLKVICGDPKVLPPQICKGDVYIGDYDKFDAAIENETLEEFLKL
ncbi:hypothetical protein [Salmonella sp. s51933]